MANKVVKCKRVINMKKCCCLTTIIIFVLIIAILCVALFVLTPNMIGLGDIAISGDKTLNDLGLGDVTIFEVLKTLSALTTPADPEQILGEDAYNDSDLNSASSSLGMTKDSEGNIDYSSILEGVSINQTGVTVTLTDKEFAAVANDILDYVVESSSGGDDGNEAMGILENLNIYQLSPQIKSGSNKVELTTTVGLSVKDLLNSSGEGASDNPLSQVLSSLPDEMLLTLTLPLENTEDGYVFSETDDIKNIKINGQEMDIVNDLVNGFEIGEGEEKQTINEMLHGAIGGQISTFMNQWGVTLGNGSVTIAPTV